MYKSPLIFYFIFFCASPNCYCVTVFLVATISSGTRHVCTTSSKKKKKKKETPPSLSICLILILLFTPVFLCVFIAVLDASLRSLPANRACKFFVFTLLPLLLFFLFFFACEKSQVFFFFFNSGVHT